MKTTFTRKKSGKVSVSFKDMTQGEAFALCHALDKHALVSLVCKDVETSLKYTILRDGRSDEDQELFEALTMEESNE